MAPTGQSRHLERASSRSLQTRARQAPRYRKCPLRPDVIDDTARRNQKKCGPRASAGSRRVVMAAPLPPTMLVTCDAGSLAPGVGSHVDGYNFVDAASPLECCGLCAADAKCDHFVFRTTLAIPSAESLAADAPCHLKHGSALGKVFDCPECISGGAGVAPLPPPSPPYPPPSPAPEGAPNLLLLFPDEWRYDWAGIEYPHTASPSGRIPLHLPNTAALAAKGTLFTQAYVPAPVCAPSRSCLASAREYDYAGVLSNFANDYPSDQPTFYGQLRAAGYHTMTTGKDDLTKATQLGSAVDYAGCGDCVAGDGRYHQDAMGFSDGLRYCGKMDVVNHPDPHEMYGYFLRNQSVRTQAGANLTGWDGHRACLGKGDASLCDATSFPQELYEDDWTAANAIALLRRRPKNKPWMLHVSFPGPHPPFVVTADSHDAVAGRYWPQPADNPQNKSTLGGRCNATGEPDGSNLRCVRGSECRTARCRLARALLLQCSPTEGSNCPRISCPRRIMRRRLRISTSSLGAYLPRSRHRARQTARSFASHLTMATCSATTAMRQSQSPGRAALQCRCSALGLASLPGVASSAQWRRSILLARSWSLVGHRRHQI